MLATAVLECLRNHDSRPLLVHVPTGTVLVDGDVETKCLSPVRDIETVRYQAYLLAESDGFKQSPDYYWYLAEQG